MSNFEYLQGQKRHSPCEQLSVLDENLGCELGFFLNIFPQFIDTAYLEKVLFQRQKKTMDTMVLPICWYRSGVKLVQLLT